ncbi:MAG: histidine phosphatase family protein [Acidobacteria bacterium]|nr:histidine phosphatase family protein [Acidobacteriota bacterium]
MKFLVSVVGVVMVAAWMAPSVAEAQMVIVVRHAERADGGTAAPGTAMTGANDPELSAAGKARAQALAAMLKDAGVTAIYTTEYTRTKDTAAPLAAALKVTAEIVSARDQAALISKIKAHSAGAVLVVGHSNTVPTIIKALGGADVTLAETEYDSLFFVAPGGVTTRIRFKP